MNIKANTIFVLLTTTLAMFSLSSCEDNSLAKSMDGTWKGGITTKYDDQSTEDQDVYLKFTYKESDDKDGGDYVEVRNSKVQNVDLDDEKMSATYRTYIEGTWEIIAGELYMKPNVSSLKVSVSPEDVKISYNNMWAALDDLDDVISSLGFSRQEIVDDMQKDIYKDLFHQYKDDADNADEESFSDLKVNGGTMSFKSDDVGTITLNKVNVDINSVYNAGGSVSSESNHSTQEYSAPESSATEVDDDDETDDETDAAAETDAEDDESTTEDYSTNDVDYGSDDY